MPSLDRERAAFAWQKVQDCSDEYENLAKAAPALIMTNGLMQTLAFFESKGKDHHKNLNMHIFEWLGKRFHGEKPKNTFKEIMDFLNSCDSVKYRQATEEVLALLRWIRQFASAVNASSKEER